MRIRKSDLVGLACLLVLSLGIVVAGSAPASAQRARVVWPFHYFAPYSYDASSQTDLVTLARASGTRFFTLAFIGNARGNVCQASWNSKQPVGSWMQASINGLRAMGGDVSVAFGGADLAGACPTLASLQAQYRLVVKTYNLTHLDFDIEGRNLADARVNQLRNRAVAGLQREFALAGWRLVISYTLPTTVTGLTPAGVSLLHDALQAGVHLAGINLMTMNYYSPRAPGDRMAQNAIRTANSVVQQLHLLYPNRTAVQLWGMLGITPMIGVNNDLREIFTLQDARTLLNFAEERRIARLAFWSIQRDDRCERGEVAPHHCSGVPQQPYQYARTFAGFDL
jgi:chitinase